jgi:hypothetical protein
MSGAIDLHFGVGTSTLSRYYVQVDTDAGKVSILRALVTNPSVNPAGNPRALPTLSRMKFKVFPQFAYPSVYFAVRTNMRTSFVILIVVLGMIAVVSPITAHHSYCSEFDVNRPVFMNGKVTKVQWGNPHVVVFIDVKDKQGKTTNWDVQANSPKGLLETGWKVDSLRMGMDVCVEGFPEKTGKPIFGSIAIMLKATGQVLKTPPGMWMCPTGKIQSEVAFSGKLSCSNRDTR